MKRIHLGSNDEDFNVGRCSAIHNEQELLEVSEIILNNGRYCATLLLTE